MIIIRKFLFLVLLGFPFTKAIASYLYPIGVCVIAGKANICYIYQKSLNNLELWLYNNNNQKVEKGLWSIYTPAHVTFSPNGKQFSFIDNGRIRIHSFLKRAARSLEFTEPLYDILTVGWAGNNDCYFSAKQLGHYAVFQTDMDGTISHLLSASDADYLYPQKIDNQLFAVKRVYLKSGYRYQIIKIPYKPYKERAIDSATNLFGASGDMVVSYSQEDNSFDEIKENKEEYVILNAGSKIVAFLSMISATKGFFARFNVPINQEKNLLKISYHTIYKNGKLWRSNQLFTFYVPTKMIFGSERLHESLLPLLPRYFDDALYYASAASNGDMTLYTYNCATGQITWIGGTNNFCFAPLLYENELFYGTVNQEAEEGVPFISQ